MPHFNTQVEALVNVPDRVMNVLPNLRVGQSGNVDLTYLGKINRAGAIYGKLGIEIDLPPDANDQLVTGPKDVARSDIHLAKRSECRRDLAK